MLYSDFRRIRHRQARDKPLDVANKQDLRLLHSVHLKTIENRTLLETLRQRMAPSEYDDFIVEYAIRLRKARKNFEQNNIAKELDMIAYESELEEQDSEIVEKKVDHSF